MVQKETRGFKLRLSLPAFFKAPFSRRGKKKAQSDGDESSQTSSHEDFSATGAPTGEVESSQNRVETDATSTTRGSRSSFDASASQQGPTPTLTTAGQELSSVDGRSQSPAPSQARSNRRQSVSKTTSGENVRVSFTVDTIKQQLNDGLQILAEFKKSLRPSSDVQRYDEAVGSFEGAAKGLATLKSKLSNRKVTGNPNRNSYILPPPDLKVEFEDTPFSMTIPGIEEEQKKETSTLGVVQESKENEVQEEEEGEKEVKEHQQEEGVRI